MLVENIDSSNSNSYKCSYFCIPEFDVLWFHIEWKHNSGSVASAFSGRCWIIYYGRQSNNIREKNIKKSRSTLFCEEWIWLGSRSARACMLFRVVPCLVPCSDQLLPSLLLCTSPCRVLSLPLPSLWDKFFFQKVSGMNVNLIHVSNSIHILHHSSTIFLLSTCFFCILGGNISGQDGHPDVRGAPNLRLDRIGRIQRIDDARCVPSGRHVFSTDQSRCRGIPLAPSPCPLCPSCLPSHPVVWSVSRNLSHIQT